MRMSELWYEQKNIMDAEGHHLPIALLEAMTLRDQFAMAALSAIIQSKDIHTTTQAAETAYHMADAMLKARKAK